MSEVSSPTLPFREIGFVLLAAIAVYALLAIASYSPLDPSWGHAGTDLRVSNLVGISGAWIAEFALLAFGWVAYLLVAGLVIAGGRLLMARGLPWSWTVVGIRFLGFFALVASACLLFRLHAGSPPELPAGAGGAIGDSLFRLGIDAFKGVGLTLIAFAWVLVGTQLTLGFTWKNLVGKTGLLIHRWIRVCVRIAKESGHTFGLGFNYLKRLKLARFLTHRSAPVARVRTKSAAKAKVAARKSVTKIEPVPKPKAVSQRRLFDLKTPNEMPDLDLLEDQETESRGGYSSEALDAMGKQLELKLLDFGVEAEVVSILPGPVITRFEVQPAAGVKVSKISALAKDLARSLAVISVRIVEVIPGKSVVGIEIPNEIREVVRLKDVLGSKSYQDASSVLTLALGKDIAGDAVLADLGKMPHLLVAGTTGSGKSVGINAMLLSMLYKASPEEVRLILVDPKMLELAVYEGIPHLLTPVVTDMKEASQSLNWCIREMDRRYQLMAALGVRNLAGFNRRILEAQKLNRPILDPFWPEDALEPASPLEKLPLIVVVIDEFADMIMLVGKKVEQLIARIAQKARAAGIHLILATQRPSVDVITGLIKANIPTRISFQVSSKVDSRTILDQGGAEQLLGHGDMLFLPPGAGVPIRVHGAFVSDDEVHGVVSDWKERGDPDYLDDVLSASTGSVAGEISLTGDTESDEPLYDEAVAFILESRRASISSVQRKLRIGYNRAARLIEAMEEAGVVSAMNSNGSREVLVPDRDA